MVIKTELIVLPMLVQSALINISSLHKKGEFPKEREEI